MSPPQVTATGSLHLRPVNRAAFLAGSSAVVCPLIGPSVPASAAFPGIRIGVLEPGPLDAITDIAGVRVGHVTKIEGSGPLVSGVGPIRTGVTVILPNDDPWMRRVSAAPFALNGNGEMTGVQWIEESGFLETPIALTNTLDVGRVDDGVISWLIDRYPKSIPSDDVPLPVVAECDDQGFNDIVGRHVSAADTARALNEAHGGAFERGAVGAGTGMHGFGFKGGIGTASRRTATTSGYLVGVLVNLNLGSRSELTIAGVPIGRLMKNELLPVFPRRAAAAPVDPMPSREGSIVVIIATDAPLIPRQLRELCLRAVLGLGRTGATSHVSSGDLFLAFSTTQIVPRNAETVSATIIEDHDRLDTLFAASAEATEAAIVDALLSARTMTGANDVTLYGLPAARVREFLRQYGRG